MSFLFFLASMCQRGFLLTVYRETMCTVGTRCTVWSWTYIAWTSRSKSISTHSTLTASVWHHVTNCCRSTQWLDLRSINSWSASIASVNRFFLTEPGHVTPSTCSDVELQPIWHAVLRSAPKTSQTRRGFLTVSGRAIQYTLTVYIPSACVYNEPWQTMFQWSKHPDLSPSHSPSLFTRACMSPLDLLT